MQRYVLKGMIQDRVLYYAGKHFQMTSAFTGNLQQATLYSDSNDAKAMASFIAEKFHALFSTTPVKVTVVEMTSR